MSAIKANKVQIGQSATPGNNITIETPAVPDGSFSIRKGTHDGSGTVLLNVDASGNPTFPSRIARTLQNMTGSRALSTVYTNNTNQDIDVYVRGTATANQMLQVRINGTYVLSSELAGATVEVAVPMFRVPPGFTYTISPSVTGTLLSWYELRE